MKLRIPSLLLAAALALPAQAHADFYIVVPVESTVHALTQKEAVDLFMGRNRAFANGEPVAILDLPRDHPLHAQFYQALTGMGPAQVNSYWARLMFSGQNMPPRSLPDESSIIEAVKRHPNTLAWLSKEPADKRLRTVLVLKEVP
jgi:hypothetical protein